VDVIQKWSESNRIILKNTDNLLNHLIESFSNIATIEFFGRLNCDKFDAYKLKFNIPDNLVQKLIRVRENEFDSLLLKNGPEYLR
jgi:hypothetical protein